MKFLFTLIASALAAYALSLWLTVAVNPESAFWHQVVEDRRAGLAEVRNANPDQSVILFTGGSSTAFSIDPAIIEEACGRPAFNLGLPASAGPRYILQQALEQARAGDVLVIGLEADFLAYEFPDLPSSFAWGIGIRDGEIAKTISGSHLTGPLRTRDVLNLSRPGARYLLTLGYRALTGKGYRYTAADMRYRGRIETQVDDPAMAPYDVLSATRLSASGRVLLEDVRQAAAARGVPLLYAMPWRYTSQENAETSRRSNAGLLADIDALVAVIDDGSRGVSTARDYFSDSMQHLSAAGSAARTRSLAPELRKHLAADDAPRPGG